jgi:hypothetical protein
MVVLSVKDEYFLERNKFLGETQHSVTDIPKSDITVSFENLGQIHLKLSQSRTLGKFYLLVSYSVETIAFCRTIKIFSFFRLLQYGTDKQMRGFIKSINFMFLLAK